MTNDKNVLEGNKLIAEFDGWEFLENGSVTRPDHSDHGRLIELRKDILQYHSSWDWLMPVIEKISLIKIKYSNDSDYYSPYPRTFGMQDEDGNFMVRLNVNPLFTAPTLIEAAWLAVVEFIKWYNQNKKL